MRTSMEILGRVKEALVPTPTRGELTLPLAARASLLLDLCDLEDVPPAYVPTVSALWDLVEQLEATSNGALAARQLNDTLEIACPHCPRPDPSAPSAPSAPFKLRAADVPPAARTPLRGFAVAGWQH
jgi:hypothetical protein